MSTYPNTLQLGNDEDYEAHFHENLCRSPIRTSNGTPIFVPRFTFRHAFYESDHGSKDNVFSLARAERMMWIEQTLADGSALRLQGWDSRRKSYAPNMCVFNLFDDFVVVVRISRDDATGALKGNFVTCYVADRSISKIQSAPAWNHADFVAWEAQKGQGNGR